MAQVGLSMLMAMSILDNGHMIKRMVLALICLNVALSMSEIGLMINRTAMDNRLGQMKLFISESIKLVKSTAKANSCGLTTVHIMGTSSKTTFMATANINGKTAEYMKESGKIIKCKAKALSHGQMEENMSAIIFRIGNKALGYLLSKMVEFTRDNGSMENNTEKVSSKRKTSHVKEFGKMERELNGLMRKSKTQKT
jgi:hypothetical protein